MIGVATKKGKIWKRKGKSGKQVVDNLAVNQVVGGVVDGDRFVFPNGHWTLVKWLRLDPAVVPPPDEPPPPPVEGEYRLVWDDENPDYDYKCRTQQSGWNGPDNPPAVMRYYTVPKDGAGDFRVRLSTPHDWKPAILKVNGGDEQKFNYLTGPSRATYNTTGWDKQAYISMCGNILEVIEIANGWVRFRTLKPSDVNAAMNMTIETHPQFVHRFTCVTWDRATKTTKRINSTGTPRGDVFYFLVTNEGEAYIPARLVVRTQTLAAL